MRIGLHTSIAGSLEGAALHAAKVGANTFQIFSSSPRQWRASVPDPDAILRLQTARDRFDLTPLVIHDSYLINLASADPVIRAKSIDGFRGELVRAIAIGAEFLVAHPGNYKGQTIEQGILNVVQGLAEASRGLVFGKLMLLLECTVGAGAQLGGVFQELHVIRDYAEEVTDLPIGFCLDTCHLLAAGHDIASVRGLRVMVEEADAVLGLDRVHVIHTNDSKAPLGSHIDRHEQIGAGYIGLSAFRRILTHPRLRSKAFILETPVEEDGDDQKNVETLKQLCRKKSRTTTMKLS